MAKKYYWLKLKEDFFESKEMKILRKMPSGSEITIVLLKLQLYSLKTNGLVEIDRVCETLEEEISIIINEDKELVKLSLLALEKFNFINIDEDIEVLNFAELIGSESASTLRSRKSRANKTLQCNSNATLEQQTNRQNATVEQQKCNTEIDIDLDLDTDIKLDIDKDKDINSDVVAKQPRKYSSEISEVIEYLNLRANTKFKPTAKDTVTKITSLLKQGYTLEDFKTVIDRKSKQWLNSDMQQYLRPITLFSSKFDNYLGETDNVVMSEANRKAQARYGELFQNDVQVNNQVDQEDNDIIDELPFSEVAEIKIVEHAENGRYGGLGEWEVPI